MSNFWQEDDQFLDSPVEMGNDGQWHEVETEEFAPQPQRSALKHNTTPVAHTVIQGDPELDLFPNGDPDEEEDYSDVLSDARLRLEQGKLYELIMNHDLFSGSDSDPRAVKHVQREIRKFAKERMEIMLGMRRETTKVESLQIDFPFNQVEVEVLKKLAFAASKGASESSDRFVPEVKRLTEEVPVIKRPPVLNAIGSQKQTPKPRPLKAQPKSPIQRQQRPEPQVSQGEYKPLEKSPQEMTEEELLQRNKETTARLARHRTVKSKDALPQPTFEEQQMMYSTRAANAAPAVATILAAMNSNSKK